MRFFQIVFACLIAIGLYNFFDALVDNTIHGNIYQCSEKQSNPPDVQLQCKRLTRGQWWHR
jgi:hypothetical protein